MVKLIYNQNHLYEADARKKSFVACRMESSLFQALMERAKKENSDLSEVIRTLCKQGLRY